MKKILFLTSLMMLFMTVQGQVSVGSFTVFPDSKLFGLAYKPELAIGKVNDQYIIDLRYVSPKTYASFDEESILLLKLNDDSVVKLPIAKELDVVKKYDNSYSKYGTSHFYITYSYYYIDDETLNKLLKGDKMIIKIRASFTNGDVEDWEIKTNYQSKLKEGLVKSFQKAEAEDAVRKEKIDDVESGF